MPGWGGRAGAIWRSWGDLPVPRCCRGIPLTPPPLPCGSHSPAVDVVDGPLKGKSGTVQHLMRGHLFLQSREVADNGGFICVPARSTRVRGGRSRAPGSALMTPGRTPIGGVLASPYTARLGAGAGANVLASPGRLAAYGRGGGGGPGGGGGGQFSGRVTTQQDRLLEGREITIRKGPYRGMRGRVVSATATHVRMELQAQMKQVTVDRAHLPEEEGGVAPSASQGPSRSAWPPTATPMHAGGRTPMHPGITATPMHYSSHATPMHPGFTPSREAVTKTPAYDAAWAATPAHPGISGGGAGPAPRACCQHPCLAVRCRAVVAAGCCACAASSALARRRCLGQRRCRWCTHAPVAGHA